MKITKSQLKRIIKEELESVLNEKDSPMDCAYNILSAAADQISKNCGVLAGIRQDGGGPGKEPDAYILTVKP